MAHCTIAESAWDESFDHAAFARIRRRGWCECQSQALQSAQRVDVPIIGGDLWRCYLRIVLAVGRASYGPG
jgi:hypothetical protein